MKNAFYCFTACLCLFTGASVSGKTADVDNIIAGGTFDKHNARGLPDGPSWSWKVSGGKSLAIEYSQSEKYSGVSSLHLLDTDRGKSNDGLTWMMAGNRVAQWRGKSLQLSCMIKQVKAFKSKSVGVGYWLKCRDGKVLRGFAGPDTVGETIWKKYELTVNFPQNAEIFLVFLYCAKGWGNDGEAYFDDLQLTPLVSAPVSPEAKRIDFGDLDLAGAFYFFNGKLLPLWRKQAWGGLYCEQKRDKQVLEAATVNGAKAFAGIGLSCGYVNRVVNLDGIGSDNQFFLYIKPFVPLQVVFAGKTVVVSRNDVKNTQGGWFLVSIPLARFGSGDKFKGINSVKLQFPEPLAAGTVIEIGRIGVTGAEKEVVTDAVLPEIAEQAQVLCCGLNRTWSSDAYKRPEIRNGVFYSDNTPVFFLGPWIDSMLLRADFGPGTKRDFLKDDIYNRMFDDGIAKSLGVNSFQLSAAARLPFFLEQNLPWGRRMIDNTVALAKMYHGLRGMPYIQDFAWINWLARPLVQEDPANKKLLQHNTEWHEFIPLCPEHKKAVEIYSSYFRTGTAFALANDANPFIYEIFNESNYMCNCEFNRRAFATEIQQRFKTVAAANQSFGIKLKSFNEIANFPRYETIPALWVEWCKFMARRYATILRQYAGVIREVDRRPNVYMTEQVSVSSLLIPRGAGMDYRLIADELDVLTTEGGWHFGQSHRNGGNPMEDAMMSSAYPFVADFFVALGKGLKPVVNNEHYCHRKRFGKRVPSKKEDLVTAMWAEVFHGVSGSFPYAWCKRVWEWHNLKEAKAAVYDGGYKAANMLNPYSWPREALNGFKQFSGELAGLAQIALPQPRRAPGKVALIYSYPSLRMSAINHENIKKQLLNCYFSLLYNQYPVEIVFAEDIPTGALKRFDAVILPAIRNADEKTITALRDYAAGGGLVVCAGNALSEDEYGRPLNATSLLGLSRKSGNVIPAGAENNGKYWKNSIGKGSVAYVEETFADPRSAAMVSGILEVGKIGRYFTIDSNPEKLSQVEVQLIDRGDTKLVLLVNWEDNGTKLVRLRYTGSRLLRKQYIYSPVTKKMYLNGDSSQWNDDALRRRGVDVILPPQTRVLLLLSISVPRGHVEKISSRQLLTEFEQVRAGESKALEEANKHAKKMREEYFKARNYAGINASDCVPLNLLGHVNAGFKDELAGDRKGGWFDQGTNDYQNAPAGNVVLANVPFTIINPENNNEKSVIVMRGKERPYFTNQVKGIPVKMQTKSLFILHTAGWSQKSGTACYYLRVKYADGGKLTVPVRFGIEIGGWWNPTPLSQAKIAHEMPNAVCKRVGLYCWKWSNPEPYREIASIDLISGKDNAVPGIIAITAGR